MNTEKNCSYLGKINIKNSTKSIYFILKPAKFQIAGDNIGKKTSKEKF